MTLKCLEANGQVAWSLTNDELHIPWKESWSRNYKIGFRTRDTYYGFDVGEGGRITVRMERHWLWFWRKVGETNTEIAAGKSAMHDGKLFTGE